MIDFQSIEQMLRDTEEQGLPLWENIQLSDCRQQDISREASWKKMSGLLEAMIQADESYREEDRSNSGLTGGDGGRMTRYGRQTGEDSLCGAFFSEVIAGALRMGECNACMKRIVAAPTAGACGVLPAVLLPCRRRYGLSDEALVQALYIASGFGMIIAERACIAGAEGGCQAECGSAAAMAAAAVVEMLGGTPRMAFHGAAMALKNVLGLTCDPVAGLVEIPCIKRNASGAVNALLCADLALAGVESYIPFDEVVDAMYAVGKAMPMSLRETAKGGLAVTPTGLRMRDEIR